MKTILLLLCLCVHFIQSNKVEHFTWPNICDKYVEAGGVGKSEVQNDDREHGRRCSITFRTFIDEENRRELMNFCEVVYPDYFYDLQYVKQLKTHEKTLICKYRSEYTCGKSGAISHKGLCYTVHKAEVTHEEAKKLCVADGSILAKADKNVLAFFVKTFTIDDVYAYWVDGYGTQVGQPLIHIAQLDPLAHTHFEGQIVRAAADELHSVLCSKPAMKYPTLPIQNKNIRAPSIEKCDFIAHFNLRIKKIDDICFYWTQSVVGPKRKVQADSDGKLRSEAYLNVDHFHGKCKFGGEKAYAVNPSTKRNFDTLKDMQQTFLRKDVSILLPAVLVENWPSFDLNGMMANKKKFEDDIIAQQLLLKETVAQLDRDRAEKRQQEATKRTAESNKADSEEKIRQNNVAIETDTKIKVDTKHRFDNSDNYYDRRRYEEEIAKLEKNIAGYEQNNAYNQGLISNYQATIDACTKRIGELVEAIRLGEIRKAAIEAELTRLHTELTNTIQFLWENVRKCQDSFAYIRDGGAQWKMHHTSYWPDLSFFGQPIFSKDAYNQNDFATTLLQFSKNQQLENTMGARRGPIVCAPETYDQKISYSCPNNQGAVHMRERGPPVCYAFHKLPNCGNYEAGNELCVKNGGRLASLQNKGDEAAIIGSFVKDVKLEAGKKTLSILLGATNKNYVKGKATKQDYHWDIEEQRTSATYHNWLLKQADLKRRESYIGGQKCLSAVYTEPGSLLFDEQDCGDAIGCDALNFGVVCEALAVPQFDLID